MSDVRHRPEIEQLLREALRARDDFLSIAGHELKTPLTPLAIRLHALERDLAEQPPSLFVDRVRAYTEVARRQLGRLSQLINDLLEASRISAGRLHLASEQIDLAEVLRETVVAFPAEVRLDAPASLRGELDPLRFAQIVDELMDNAVKYGAGRPIEVQLTEEKGRARLTVTDHGIGIAPEHLERIFERFERADSHPGYGGLGLGLFFIRSVVESLGGRVLARSQPDHGSTFTVELPLDDGACGRECARAHPHATSDVPEDAPSPEMREP